MTKHRKHALIVVAVLSAVACGAAAADTAPTAVERAVAHIFGHKKLGIEHEKKQGKDVYSAEVRTNLEVSFDGAGAVRTIEIDIPVNLAPSAARTAAKKALGTTPHEAAIIIRGNQTSYQFERATKRGDMEVFVTAGGVVQSKGLEAADHDDDND